ncbi:hypothetical protein [Nonlabens sp.]|uniref:hypothetical protein n=1 Tax=Nonlabens sp. TaxID=1888209 RepID=UPI0032660E8F
MKYWVEYLFIVLGASTALFSIYRLTYVDEYFSEICGIITGVFLIKVMLDKIKSRKEKELNQD